MRSAGRGWPTGGRDPGLRMTAAFPEPAPRCCRAASSTPATGWSAGPATCRSMRPGRPGSPLRGAVVEPGSPAYDFAINDRATVWAAEVADLYEQATANQWDASRDVPWG